MSTHYVNCGVVLYWSEANEKGVSELLLLVNNGEVFIIVGVEELDDVLDSAVEGCLYIASDSFIEH